MENNIPFGFEDNGEPSITLTAGTTSGCKRYLNWIEVKREKERKDYEDKLNLPSTPEQANLYFIQQRKKNENTI